MLIITSVLYIGTISIWGKGQILGVFEGFTADDLKSSVHTFKNVGFPGTFTVLLNLEKPLYYLLEVT